MQVAVSKEEAKKNPPVAAVANPPVAKPEPVSGSAAPAAAAPRTCAALGCTGDGKGITKPCTCPASIVVPLTVKATGGDHHGTPEYELTNSSPDAIEWAGGRVYYFDTEGKLVQDDKKQDFYGFNGSTLAVDGSGSRKVGLGSPTDRAPKGSAKAVVVLNAWCWGDVRARDDEFCAKHRTPVARMATCVC